MKQFNEDKGYGFIARESGEKDIFVHHNNIRDERWLKEGGRVEFTVIKGKKGPLADDVVALD